jgi:Mn2+/Fe2+ NRAMP family transporter
MKFIKMLGPGLLFAGAAVGVSHLVQGTRAGADYGFGLLWVVFLIHLVKYPFFEFGPRYAASTGEDLIQGYQKLGDWVLALFAVITIGTMFTVQAAVTIVTAGLAINIFGITENPVIWSMIILGICTLILTIGKYQFLDNLMKIIIITLTISTLFAVGLALNKESITVPELSFDLPLEGAGLVFLIALMGWMPAPLDLSAWHSMWTNEKQKTTIENVSLKQSLLDFRIGYIGTVILAISFLVLGALVMFNSGETFAASGGAFSAQLINMYTSALGDWAKWLIAVAAFTTMFSTTLTCLDALSRSIARATTLAQSKRKTPKETYWIWLGLLIIGALIILQFFIQSMGQMVKVATILSFLTTPFFAIANYRLITGKNTPKSAQPGLGLKIWSWFGILFLVGFAVVYLVTLF